MRKWIKRVWNALVSFNELRDIFRWLGPHLVTVTTFFGLHLGDVSDAIIFATVGGLYVLTLLFVGYQYIQVKRESREAREASVQVKRESREASKERVSLAGNNARLREGIEMLFSGQQRRVFNQWWEDNKDQPPPKD